MFELDLRSRLPIYEQLVDKFKELIITEVLNPGEQLPSVRTLAGRLTINPNTIQKAYKELERQGYIHSARGKGHFVAPLTKGIDNEKKVKLENELEKILSELMYLGVEKKEIEEIVSRISTAVKGGESSD